MGLPGLGASAQTLLHQVLSGALTVALSGRCDQDVLRLLLAFPEDGKAGFATKELCGLPGARVYTLLVSVIRNLDLRNFIYKVGCQLGGPVRRLWGCFRGGEEVRREGEQARPCPQMTPERESMVLGILYCVFSSETLMPAEAKGLLSSLLDIISRLSHLLPRASHVLEHLPQFLHTANITALLDVPDFQQVCVTWASGKHSDMLGLGSFCLYFFCHIQLLLETQM